MQIKEKVDIIAKKLDIVKSKAIGFMAIAGGSWVYAIKINDITVLILAFGWYLHWVHLVRLLIF